MDLIDGIKNDMDIRDAFKDYRYIYATIFSTKEEGQLIRYIEGENIKQGIIIRYSPLIINVEGEIIEIDDPNQIEYIDGFKEKIRKGIEQIELLTEKVENEAYLITENYVNKKKLRVENVNYISPIVKEMERPKRSSKRVGVRVVNRIDRENRIKVNLVGGDEYKMENVFVCDVDSLILPYPGKDKYESLRELDMDRYRDLAQVKNWRRMLSNYEIMLDKEGNRLPVVVDGKIFPSIIHGLYWYQLESIKDVGGSRMEEINRLKNSLLEGGSRSLKGLKELEEEMEGIRGIEVEWDKYMYMKKLVYGKYYQNEEIGKVLKMTEGATLARVERIEGNVIILVIMQSVMEVREMIKEDKEPEFYMNYMEDKLIYEKYLEERRISYIENKVRKEKEVPIKEIEIDFIESGMEYKEEEGDNELLVEEGLEEVELLEGREEEEEMREIIYYLFPLDMEGEIYYIAINYVDGIYIPLGYWSDETHKIKYLGGEELDERVYEELDKVLGETTKGPDELHYSPVSFYVGKENKVYWRKEGENIEIGELKVNRGGMEYIRFN